MKPLVLCVLIAGCAGARHRPSWFSTEALRQLINSSGTIVRGRMVFDARGEPGAYTGEIAVTKPVMGSGPKEIRFVSPVLETRTGEMLFFLHQEGNRWRVIPPGTGLLGMDPGEEASVIEVLEGSYVGSGRDEEGHR